MLFRPCFVAVAFIFLGLLIASCQPAAKPPSGQDNAAATQATSTIKSAWQSSPHADTYVEKDGMNSACTACHAPINYVPPVEEIPKSCFVCKFDVKPPPPLTGKTEWKSIPCSVCHQVTKDVVNPKVMWLTSIAANEYQTVATSTELCQKCHLADKPPHTPVVVNGLHANLTCTQCHNAHSAAATCSTSECHKDILVLSSIAGHDARHQAVACEACHDGSKLAVKPDPANKNTWFTFLPDGTAFASHNIVRKVQCERCHFPANPWKLVDNVLKLDTK